MALIPSTRYPAQVDTGIAAYPLGKPRNAGSYQDGTGTPLEKDWLADVWGFEQALLDAAKITPSGTPDGVGASQYLEAVRAVAVSSTLQRNLTRALALRAVDLNGITPISNGYLAAVSLGGAGTLVAKGFTNGVFSVVDTPFVKLSGATVTGINELRKLIRGSTRTLAIGDGTTKNAFTANSGTTWTAGGSSGLGFTPTDGVWNGTQFVISTDNGHAAHSTNGTTWATATSGSDISNVLAVPDGGLATLSGGKVVAAGGQAGSGKAFATSTDHGQTWSLAGTIPTSSDYTVNGHIAGNGSTEVYWLGKPSGADRLDLFVSTTGATWTKRSEIPGFAGYFKPKLLMCLDTGLLVAAQEDGGAVAVSASADRGATWSARAYYNVTDTNALAVASGRIFATIGAKLFATDVL